MAISTAGSSRGRAQLVVVFALVVTVIAGAVAGVNALKLSRDSQAASHPTATSTKVLSASATTALAEGGQLAVDFTSFNYQDLAQDFSQTASHATPAFAKVYLAQSRSVATLIKKAKAVSVSQVVATGLASFSAAHHTATVIVALNDTTKNTKSTAGTVQYFRMQVQMVSQNGQWLASQVTPE